LEELPEKVSSSKKNRAVWLRFAKLHLNKAQELWNKRSNGPDVNPDKGCSGRTLGELYIDK